MREKAVCARTCDEHLERHEEGARGVVGCLVVIVTTRHANPDHGEHDAAHETDEEKNVEAHRWIRSDSILQLKRHR
jgi:hypothetical protein